LLYHKSTYHKHEGKFVPILKMNEGVKLVFHAFLSSSLERCGRLESQSGHIMPGELDDRGSRFRFPAGTGNVSLHHRDQNSSGARPTSYPMGTRGSFPGVKRSGREADHSPPSSAEVKNAWSYTSAPNTSSWSCT
jgi:hypothetical protein